MKTALRRACYENHGVGQSEAMDSLIRLEADIPEALRWLAQQTGDAELVGAVTSQGVRIYLSLLR